MTCSHFIMADEEEVWVQLYIGERECGRAFPIDIASLAKDRIHELTEAVHQANNNVLGHCNAAQLVVYNPGTEIPLDKEAPLNAWDGLPKDTTGLNAIRVVAPDLEQQGKNFIMLSFLR
jgi:hypothetical protein